MFMLSEEQSTRPDSMLLTRLVQQLEFFSGFVGPTFWFLLNYYSATFYSMKNGTDMHDVLKKKNDIIKEAEAKIARLLLPNKRTWAWCQRARELGVETSTNHRTVSPEDHSHIVGSGEESAQTVVADFAQKWWINIWPIIDFNVVAGTAVFQPVFFF